MRIAPLSPLLALLLTASVARAEPPAPASSRPSITLTGIVESSTSKWTESGRSIVTDSVVRTDDGTLVTIRQLGGKVGDLRMWVSHVPSTEPAVGARIEAVVSASIGDDTAPLPVLELYDYGLEGGANNFVPTRTAKDRTILRWPGRTIAVTFDPDGVSDLQGDREFEILESVLATWELAADSCDGLTFDITEREDGEVGNDNVSRVLFREDAWCRPDAETCYSPNAAAITTVFFFDNPDSGRNGLIVEADIEINAVDFAVSDNGTTASSESCLSDLANTMTHEFGHLLGLDHTCAEPPREGELPAIDGNGDPVPLCGPGLDSEILETTMFPSQTCGETDKSTPEADDIDGVCNMLVLADESAGLTDDAGCGCRTSGGTSAGGWLLLLATAALTRRRRP